MSLLSLSLFASVCLMLEPIYVMLVRLDVVGAQCETRPFLSRVGGSHCVFVVCLLLAQCANTQPPLLCCCHSLLIADVRRLGVSPIATTHPLW